MLSLSLILSVAQWSSAEVYLLLLRVSGTTNEQRDARRVTVSENIYDTRRNNLPIVLSHTRFTPFAPYSMLECSSLHSCVPCSLTISTLLLQQQQQQQRQQLRGPAGYHIDPTTQSDHDAELPRQTIFCPRSQAAAHCPASDNHTPLDRNLGIIQVSVVPRILPASLHNIDININVTITYSLLITATTKRRDWCPAHCRPLLIGHLPPRG